MVRQRTLFFLAAVVLLVLVSGCRISGKVTLDGTGLKGVAIVLQGETSQRTVTDRHGRFVFWNVQAGSYTVTLEPVSGWTRPITRAVVKRHDLLDAPDTDFAMASATERQTASGRVIGFTEDNGSHAWLGIPYAQAPVGNLRWRAPQPASNWEGLWLALDVGPACTQFASLLSDLPMAQHGQPTGSEDCLFLNIWAPRDLPEGSDALPVMLWIHGGGNTLGHGGSFNGRVLAEEHKVVVVTFNYRLGPFGWFAHPALRGMGGTPEDRSGNYGTLDIMHALEWVRDNIVHFDGDPDNVTIFGESAGALNVLTMLLSPRAPGLFHRAVVQSGVLWSSTMAQAENYMDDADPGDPFSSREAVNRLLISDGIVPDRQAAKAYQDEMSPDALAAYLLGKSHCDLLSIYEAGYGGMIPMPYVFQDGFVMPQGNYLELLGDVSTHNSVPVIIGSNRDEWKLFMLLDPEFVYTLFGLPVRVRDRELYRLVASYMSDHWKATYVDDIAAALSHAHPGNVWAYRFDWDEQPVILGIDLPFMVGAAHGLEIPFVFHSFDQFIAPLFAPILFTEANAPGRRVLAESMSSYWAEFAYTGAPGRGRSGSEREWPAWAPHTAAGDKFIIFDTPEGGGIRMSSSIVTLQALKGRLLAETGFPSQRHHCQLYVNLFAGADLWDDEEYALLGAFGCSEYPPGP